MTTAVLRTERLLLQPLSRADADEMVGVLADASLYAFTGGSPPTIDQLRARYDHQLAGSGRADEIWHNWIVRLAARGTAIGFVQADEVDDDAELAWVIGVAHQGHGYAIEAANALRTWFEESGVSRISAHIRPDHPASQHVASRIGLHKTGEVDADGEDIWRSRPSSRGGANS